MKKLFSYLMLGVLVFQAVVPAVKVQAQSSAEKVPAGLHLALLDAAAQEAEPIEAASDGYTLQGHGLEMHLADGHFSAQAQDGAGWGFDLHLTGIGHETQVAPLQGAVATQDQAGRVEYQYAGVTEWYRNTTLGMQQGFTVYDKPHGNGDLVLQMQLTTALAGVLSKDEHSLSFKTSDDRLLRYADLRAYDATGAALEAKLIYNPGQVVIQVKDHEAIYPLTIDPLFFLEQEVLATDGARDDWFGSSVAISGDTALVGADGDDSRQGSVYIFERDAAGVWHQTAKLTASDGAAGDVFGYSVALSGNTALVGACQEDLKGSAYIFERDMENGWRQMAKLTASTREVNDDFGHSVALSGDTALVGAWGDDDYQGSAYVFVRPAGGWEDMTETAQLTASDGARTDLFGFSVALSGDIALVGAPQDDVRRGSAFAFIEPIGGWTSMTETAKLTASTREAGDWFGLSVALSGDIALVGAPQGDGTVADQGAAYIFIKLRSGWAHMTETAKLTASDGARGDIFGWSVALYGDVALVGASGHDSAKGAAYVFEKPVSGWVYMTETTKLMASDSAANDGFGDRVALSDDNTLLVGAADHDFTVSHTGAAYFYTPKPPDTH
jgi:FG-GAP repeat protein